MVKLLLDKGADINAKSLGMTPLHRAAAMGQRDVCELLLKRGMNVDAKDHKGDTPLEYASGTVKRNVAELLITKGANVNARGKHGMTPLHEAAYKAHLDVIALLIAMGAEVNAVDEMGRTPLDLANKVASWQDEEEKEKAADFLGKNGAKAGKDVKI